MKRTLSFLFLAFAAATMSMTAQNLQVTVKSSADCTNLSVEFTVPAGKTAKLMSMDIIPSFTTCNASQPAPTTNYASVAEKGGNSAKSKGKIKYTKTVAHDGTITESDAITTIKLGAGTYVLELSKAPNLEAKLVYQLF
ncbi:hypothetical protein DSECCO2_565850 [anaerobic digester metagenome]